MKRALFTYLTAQRLMFHGGTKMSRFIIWISVTGMSLGIATMVLVLSVMNGFQQELEERLLGVVPHVKLENADRNPEIEDLLAADSAVTSTTEYFEGFALVHHPESPLPLKLIAMSPDTFMTNRLFRGSVGSDALERLRHMERASFLGVPLAFALGLDLGDPFELLFLSRDGGGLAVKSEHLVLAGVFELGSEADSSLALMNIDSRSMEEWSSLGEKGVAAQLRDPSKIESVKARIEQNFIATELLPKQSFQDWTEDYGELFRAIKMEKSIMATLLFLILVLASFSIISGQLMKVGDKRRDIAVLMTFGADRQFIRNIFLLQGLFVGLLSGLFGAALGIVLTNNANELIALASKFTGYHLLEGSYFLVVPTKIEKYQLLLVGLGAMTLSVWAAYLPASKATNLNVIENLS